MTFENTYNEWFLQSDYDLGTAEDMFRSGRYIYCFFMCHLSLEKALKGTLIKNTGELNLIAWYISLKKLDYLRKKNIMNSSIHLIKSPFQQDILKV